MKLRLLLLLVLAATGCGRPSYVPDTVPLQADKWDLQYSPGMPQHPHPAAGAAWYFNFPYSQGSVHYVTVPYRQTVPHQSISATFRIRTSGPVVYTAAESTCALSQPTYVRLFFQHKNDDMATDGYRWWSNPISYELGSADDTEITLTVPLTPDQWSGLWGHLADYSPQDQQRFEAAWRNVGRVGMTFGSCGFGHGVYVWGGTAPQFQLIEYRIQ